MAPAPTERNITVSIGEYKNPPIQVPRIVGAPATKPMNKSFPTAVLLLLAMGATIANPSVVLCIIKPTIRNELKAISPNKVEAPMANPSPKLCSPIPIAIINEMASGFKISLC